jgi:hypothetical protein
MGKNTHYNGNSKGKFVYGKGFDLLWETMLTLYLDLCFNDLLCPTSELSNVIIFPMGGVHHNVCCSKSIAQK